MKIVSLLKIIVYLLVLVVITSYATGLGLYITLFLLPFSYAILAEFKKLSFIGTREANITAGISTLLFLALAFRTDPFIVLGYFLLVLISIKLLLIKRRKDLNQLMALLVAGFSLSTIFHYSLYFIIISLLFFLLVTIYIGLNIFPEASYTNTGKVLKFFVIFTFAAFFLSIFLFVILPRNPRVFLGSMVRQSKTYYIGDIGVGNFDRDRLSGAVIGRIKPDERTKNSIYIRAYTLSFYTNGKWEPDFSGWKELKPTGLFRFYREALPSAHWYRIQLSPLLDKFLILPDVPVLISGGLINAFYRQSDRTLKIQRNSLKKLSYSVLSSDIYVPVTTPHKDKYLTINRDLKKSLREFALKNIKDTTPLGFVNFLRYGYAYGRFQKSAEQGEPTLYFLFKEKTGECTEFASALCLLLRSFNIPSRIVVGFLSSDWNTYGKYFTITGKDAHAWVEAFINGKWLRLDATPGIPPKKHILSALAQYYDFLQYEWFNHVVEFTYYEQMHVASALYARKYTVTKSPGFKLFVYFIIGLIAVFILLYIAKARITTDKKTKTIHKFLKLMQKNGYTKYSDETLLEFAIRTKNNEIVRFVHVYYNVRYGSGNIETLLKYYILLKKSLNNS